MDEQRFKEAKQPAQGHMARQVMAEIHACVTPTGLHLTQP
jgi:hypothetical protein